MSFHTHAAIAAPELVELLLRATLLRLGGELRITTEELARINNEYYISLALDEEATELLLRLRTFPTEPPKAAAVYF